MDSFPAATAYGGVPVSDRGGFWRRTLWLLIFPPRGHRISPTLPGVLLIVLSLGIGTAAYNTGSNILFITLSLLLSCLILSGILSWLNFRKVAWRLHLPPPFRAGQETLAGLNLVNRKSFLPSYGLWFDFRTGAGENPAEGTVHLWQRLDPGGSRRLDWGFTPVERGRIEIAVSGVGSLHPFGFLRKTLATAVEEIITVWPARVDYIARSDGAGRQLFMGDPVRRPGMGGDLLGLRPYRAGDSHRLVHWKASARLRKLVVRQDSAEARSGYTMTVDPTEIIWPREGQFERMVRFAATLAEDLFQEGRLTAARIAGGEEVVVRRLVDLERFLDSLAVVERQPDISPALHAAGVREITFQPDGTGGVHACIGAEIAASTQS